MRNQPVLSKDEAVETLDHDYPYLGTGKAIPHGIYDVKENKGYISLGNSTRNRCLCGGQFCVVVGKLRSGNISAGDDDTDFV